MNPELFILVRTQCASEFDELLQLRRERRRGSPTSFPPARPIPFMSRKAPGPPEKRWAPIDLRNRTGATVIAVVRGEESFTSPGAEFAVEAGDTIVLVASHRDMKSAFRFLGGEQGGGEEEG